ncbi:unnamed protein product [Peronospora belbahrii]|uniref:Uncharacterized protein n=1 Tax=Peronospora belbahrii TaxID=622444 RepID=A0AAU9LF87_9STRA|nr:unnamed protein product [Peronospora belbahrii]CAH0518131.1 unnamed protein product [Peronospora belbahrii]
MVPITTQAFEVFSERDQIRGNLSILTCTEEEEVQDYFDAEWNEQDTAVTLLDPSASKEDVYCWGSCATLDSFSVLGVCTTPPAASRKAIPRRMSCPRLMSLGDTHLLPKLKSMPPLYRPSELGIGLTSITGDPRDTESITVRNQV